MSTADNKDIALRFLESVRTHDLASFGKLVSPDVVSQIPPSCERILGYPAKVNGADANWQAHTHSRGESFTDEIRYGIKYVVAERDFVVVFLTIGSSATDAADHSEFVFLFRIQDGRIVEWREHLDTAGIFQQFGFTISKGN